MAPDGSGVQHGMALPPSPQASAHLRVLGSFGFAWAGIFHVLRTQPNFRIHLVAATVALALGVVLRFGPTELAVLLLTIALVLVAEAVNTSVEAAVDAVGAAPSVAAMHAKDAAAGAVLLSAIASIAIGLVLFLPRLASVFLRIEPR
ncbi:MAG TPA: diacylglycerol kinase family protein [Chloroflexota bacterium]|nr:diacylglycerol kinase family protein [Chloroflexota bacterium]